LKISRFKAPVSVLIEGTLILRLSSQLKRPAEVPK